ncbi:MAG: alpha-galactosidase, partial [Ginsengibacter sp.]
MKKKSCRIILTIFSVCITGVLVNCSPKSEKEVGIYLDVNKGKDIVFGNGQLELKFNNRLGCQVKYSDEHLLLNEANDSTLPSHYIISDNGTIADFALNYDDVVINDISNEFGKGKQLILKGINQQAGLEKRLTVELYDKYPTAAVWHATYTNISNRPFKINESVSDYFVLDASLTNSNFRPQEMWSFQGIAYKWGFDYIAPLKTGYARENFTGIQPESKMAGGIPMVDCWNKQMGLAIAHIEKKPILLSFPVMVHGNGKTAVSIKQKVEQILQSGEKYETIKSVVIPHHLDYFEPLHVYSSLMKDQGLSRKEPPSNSYEPSWCSWGYESDFTPQNIYDILPKLKELGIKWVVVDDRWFDRYGDWNPRKETFPGGEKQIKNFVDSLHKQGFLVQLWWAPTLAQPAAPPAGGSWPSVTPGSSDVVKKHPDWFVVDKQGQYSRCPRNMYYFNGSLTAVQDYIRSLTRKFIEDWGFDGFKLDAFWMAPPSYDAATSHPEKAYEGVPKLMEIIHETSKAIKPYSVMEICNCGTPQDFYQMLYEDQPVVADPITFLQVRLRVKLFKALWGPDCPIFTDHVEHISTFTDPVAPEIG